MIELELFKLMLERQKAKRSSTHILEQNGSECDQRSKGILLTFRKVVERIRSMTVQRLSESLIAIPSDIHLETDLLRLELLPAVEPEELLVLEALLI